jgi:predicted TIM-barrel fold metal-dependent hydrolase
MMTYSVQEGVRRTHPANMLGLDYRAEAARLPWRRPVWDVHTHLRNVEAARLFFEVADLFGVERVWTMTQLEEVDALRAAFPGRLDFIAVPNYYAKDWAEAMGPDWLRRIEGFAAKGVRFCKFWAAPRGLDRDESMRLDHPRRLEAMRLARSFGMALMFHVGDPDTWFATVYRDSVRYGTKAQQYERFARVMDKVGEGPVWLAHMAGDPEHLDHAQRLLDTYPNLFIDTSAAKWMVRELSKHARPFRDFCGRNAGRVLFGTDIVADPDTMDFDLFASRYWALRALMETDYDGPSPIVDPDLSQLDASKPPANDDRQATAILRGAAMESATLQYLYVTAAKSRLT